MIYSTPANARDIINIECVAQSGESIPADFVVQFCNELRVAVNNNNSKIYGSRQVKVALRQSGRYSLFAKVTIESVNGVKKSQEYTLSVMDIKLRPTIAKNLLFPILQLLM